MPNKIFLETYPLYRKYKITLSQHAMGFVDRPAVHMYCDVCKDGQTFNMVNNYSEENDPYNSHVEGEVVRAVYLCTSCKKFARYFFIKFGEKADYVMKVGQYPPWEIDIDPAVEKMLGEHVDDYKKGLVSESQGYGIGAFAYYRRIIEETIDTLLDDISFLLTGDDKAKYELALQKTKKTIIAQEKIELVKDLLPPILRPDGVNPLAILHGLLSEGLHAQTDEQCMGFAAGVREAIIFLVNQVSLSKTQAKSFSDHMRKFLDKKK